MDDVQIMHSLCANKTTLSPFMYNLCDFLLYTVASTDFTRTVAFFLDSIAVQFANIPLTVHRIWVGKDAESLY